MAQHSSHCEGQESNTESLSDAQAKVHVASQHYVVVVVQKGIALEMNEKTDSDAQVHMFRCFFFPDRACQRAINN